MRALAFYFVIAAVALTSCSDGPSAMSAIGEAYAGPISLNVRQEISLKSPVVATLKHGDQLEVLSIRRRFMRVRTDKGVEGWVDSEKLLTTEQMDRLKAVAEVAVKLPIQGEATVYEARNVHTEPHRQAPSFLQLKEEERFQVLGHRLVERKNYESEVSRKIAAATAEQARAAKSKKSARNKSKPKKDSDVELPPMPGGPTAPANWRELSYREQPPPEPKKEEKSPLSILIRPPQELPKFEDWSLIRTKDGKAGWILTRTLTMTIPDDVSKYAEGHRITSWFPLGETVDDGVVKKHYLWTTIARGGEPYEFDGFRVFVYSVRRHRYENGYREKNVKGYFPSAVHPVETSEGKRKYTTQGFSVVVEDETGALVRRTYAFEGYRTRLIQTTPWQKLSDPLDLKALAITQPDAKPATQEASLWERMKQKFPWNRRT